VVLPDTGKCSLLLLNLLRCIGWVKGCLTHFLIIITFF